MKAIPPKPVHESYLKHRQQRTFQIILPVVLAAVLFIAGIVLIIIATFGKNGDVGRWAAIATMWISIPICIAGFIFLALFSGVIYLQRRLLGIAPRYTGLAQEFVHRLAIRIREIADMAVKPIIALNGYGATIKAFLGRK